MKQLLLFITLCLCLQASAQHSAWSYQTKVQAGLLEGQKGSAFQLQAISGFQHRTWFGGVGGGLDYYHTRSVPVFVQLRKALWNSDKTPFLYLNGGYHFPWLKPEDKLWYIADTKGGLYMDAGVGYQLPVLKKSALYFTAGYSQKAFSQKQYDGVWIAIWPMPEPTTRVMEYTLRRLSVQTGIRF